MLPLSCLTTVKSKNHTVHDSIKHIFRNQTFPEFQNTSQYTTIVYSIITVI